MSDQARRAPFSRLHRSPRRFPAHAALVTALLVAACATPSEHYAREASAFGFESKTLHGIAFRHVAYLAGLEESGNSLHVYIEHDGTPWLDRSHVALDPTPRRPFALELMARDTGPRLLLGRPCYFAAQDDPGCSTPLWTDRRYAPEVVDSMTAALRAFLSQHRYSRIVMVGYSGGGTLAWLIASRVRETGAVVTIAANLDTDYWTTLHDYTRMSGSLNPALEAPLPEAIRQVHYVGGRDANVPPSVARAFATRHRGAQIVEFADFDHRCCWIEQWPRLMRDARIEP